MHSLFPKVGGVELPPCLTRMSGSQDWTANVWTSRNPSRRLAMAESKVQNSFGFWQRRIISICEFKIDSWEEWLWYSTFDSKRTSILSHCAQGLLTIDQSTITTYQFHMEFPEIAQGPSKLSGSPGNLHKFCWLCEALSVLSLSFGIPPKKKPCWFMREFCALWLIETNSIDPP